MGENTCLYHTYIIKQFFTDVSADMKCYWTVIILTFASYPLFIPIWENPISHTLYQPIGKIKSNSCTMEDKWRHCYVKVMSAWFVISQYIQEFLGAFLNMKMRYLMVSNNHMRMGWKNPSLVITVINQQARFFCPILTVIFDSYYL